MATTSSEQITIDDGLTVPAEITTTVTAVGGYDVELSAAYDQDTGRYVTRQVVVRSANDVEVTGEGLRMIPVAGLLRQAVASVVAPLLSPGPFWDPRGLAQAGPTDETLRGVARTYRLALLLGDAPVQRVAETFDTPRSTASRWATRARDRGYLTVIDPRGGRGA